MASTINDLLSIVFFRDLLFQKYNMIESTKRNIIAKIL